MVKNKRIIDSTPAPYPLTNTSEIKAVKTFIEIIDINLIKPDVKFLDKFPNTDGIIEMVNNSQIPIGKLEVQVKVLESKNRSTPKYQCKKDFLSYCELSLLPTLLVLVDIDDKKAYWHHIDRDTLISLSKKLRKETVSLQLKKENVISLATNKYVDQWVKIIESYQEKLYDYDKIKNRLLEISEQLQEITRATNIAVGQTDAIFKEIHLFIDYYNGLLDREFLTIKNILYPNYWKIGVGIYEYEKSSVIFSLYPVSFSTNDVLIKQFNSEDQWYLKNVVSYTGYYSENPIQSRPEQFAYELIRNNVADVLENNTLFVKDVFLSEEYIFAFVDKFHTLIGLEVAQSQYLLADIEFGLTTFLPAWFATAIESNLSLSFKPNNDCIFIIDDIYFYNRIENIIKISEKTKNQLHDRLGTQRQFKIISKDFNIKILLSLIHHLKQLQKKEVLRPYEQKDIINNRPYFAWETLGNEETLKNVDIFYRNFPRIYDSIIGTHFPKLKNDLCFFSDFNLLVVIVNFEVSSNNSGPTIELYHLYSKDKECGEVLVYDSLDEHKPIKRENLRDFYMAEIEINGVFFKFIKASFSTLRFIYEETPILSLSKKVLKENLESFFKDKITNSFSN